MWTILSKEGGNEQIVRKSIEESTEPHEEGRKAEEEEITNAATITATIENRNNATRQPLKTSDQVTLQGLSRANPCILKDMEDRNRISLHGPFYQDPKCLLKITRRHQEKGLKVTQLPDELTAACT